MPLISIIIPTLNEANWLEKTVLSARSGAVESIEVVVVDCGSSDETTIIASRLADRVHQNVALQGRKYASLNTGAQLAQGVIYVFLDADTLLPENWDLKIKTAIERGALGGAFELAFDRTNAWITLARIANRFRYRISQRYFGDQAVFCTKAAFNQVGGFPERTVMESAHFCTKLKLLGKLQLICTPVITSSRRFTSGGSHRVLLSDLWILVRDWLGLSNYRSGIRYWNHNQYRQSPSRNSLTNDRGSS